MLRSHAAVLRNWLLVHAGVCVRVLISHVRQVQDKSVCVRSEEETGPYGKEGKKKWSS